MAHTKGSMFYPNMNLLRYLLSLGILINHFNLLTGHDVPYFIPYDRIGGFFVLSGFLMYHSYMKIRNIPKFIKHRARRILPTYLFIVIFCAIGGVLISKLSISEYFSNAGFWKYLVANLSFLNWLAPTLPGVFDCPEFTNAVVNGSLWTMKVEWVLDLSVPLFVWIIGKTGWRKEYFALCIVIAAIVLRTIIWRLYISTGNQIYEIISRQAFSQMGFFYAGMLVYFYKDLVSQHLKKIILAGLILYIIEGFIPSLRPIIGPFAVAMLFLGISMYGRTITQFIHVNCISYNIFLLHYPIIQVCVMFGIKNIPVWYSLSISIIITVILAFLTNRYIDQPFSRKRKHIPSEAKSKAN